MKKRVLFLCTGNSCRSQMAEGWLRHLGGGQFDVVSAGTHPVGLNPCAVRVMQEAHVDISHHASERVEPYLTQHFDYVITVCDRAHEECPIFPGVSSMFHWNFDDPAKANGSYEQRLIVFRRIRDEIQNRIRGFIADTAG
ncbi:Arsenate reductase [Nitrospira sp. KM1]|uniref:arsenate reductase ArsC n=1 Tax=Nitrospira sp. KM1 TaxID=1936990 RepID=UPI0013A74543|nr:arsenate reductase ArsC [Nitrospira sp. KM1]BCA54940.1 Arsenate reductase [Nitrospira sp. KM1]